MLAGDSLPLNHQGSPCNCSAAAAKSLQSCPTLGNPIDGSPPGSPVPGILQARTLEWVAISFSNAGKWKVKLKSLSHVWLSDPMDCSLAGSSIHGIFRQEYWSGVPFPSPGDLPNPGIKPGLLHCRQTLQSEWPGHRPPPPKKINLLFCVKAWSRQSKHPSKLSSVLSAAVIFSFFKVSLRLSA